MNSSDAVLVLGVDILEESNGVLVWCDKPACEVLQHTGYRHSF